MTKIVVVIAETNPKLLAVVEECGLTLISKTETKFDLLSTCTSPELTIVGHVSADKHGWIALATKP